MLVNVNGVNLFYNQFGQGEPILLLHGNGENHAIFDELINPLAKQYTVYAIDSRNHGQSSKTNHLDYDTMMMDIVAFIQALNLNKPTLYGFSDGGIVGLLVASHYPDLLSKLIVSGANMNPNGLHKGFNFLIHILYFFTRNQNYKMMLSQPNITDCDMKKIAVPTFVLAGTKDLIKESHTKHLASLISNSTLSILSGETHSSYIIHSTKLYAIISPFLETT